MENVLLVVQVIVASALIGMVLLQRSDSDGFGLGSGSGNNLLSGRGAANLMTRTTAILAALFIANSVILSVLASRHHATSLVDTIAQEQSDTKTPAKADKGEAVAEKKAPEVPLAGVADKKPATSKKEAKPALKAEKSAPATVKPTDEKPSVPTEGETKTPAKSE